MWLQNYLAGRDPFMSLVPAALATSRVGLGVCVVSPWEMHPVKMANALLTLAGIQRRPGGAGHRGRRRVARAPGHQAGEARARRARGDRTGARPRTSAARPLTYQGELYKVYGYRPQFGADRPPLVYAGANQAQMLRATVPAADGVMYSDMTRGRVRETVKQTKDALAAKGRTAEGYRISNIWAWHIKADREIALREARRELLLRGLLERWYLETFLSPEDCDLVERSKPAFFKAYRERSGVIDGVPERLVASLLEHLTLTGTPDELEQRLPELRAFKAAGVNELCFRLHDDPADAIRLIGERVIPALREAGK